MRSLQIVENNPQQLLALQTSSSLTWLYAILITAAFAVMIWLIRSRQWKGLIGPIVVIVVFGIFASLPSPPEYHLRIDFQSGEIDSRGMRGKAMVSSFAVRGTDLSAADMQSNRGATAIVLTRKDGSLLYPLGEQQLQNEPDQYVVLTALRKVISGSNVK